MTGFTRVLTVLLGTAALLRGESPRLLDGGTLELDRWRGTLSAFTSQWHTLQPASAKQVFDLQEKESGRLQHYRLNLPGAAPGTLTLALNPTADGGGEFSGKAKFDRPSAIRFLCLQSALLISQSAAPPFWR